MSEPSSRPSPSNDVWLHCSACRKDIPFQAVYWVCSVSTCNRARTQLVFCSVPCWDSHLATLHHREAWAVEERAPTRAAWLAARGDGSGHPPPVHRSEAPTAPLRAAGLPAPRVPVIIPSSPASAAGTPVTSSVRPPGPAALSPTFEREILIVVSKMKKYIKDRSGMNTSDAVAEALGDHVRAVCDQAIQTAAADGRKTVLDRDVPPAGRR